MRNLFYFSACVSCLLFFTGCMPTIATMSETVTIGPNGEKTTAITKSLSQHISNTQTSSTDQVLEKFK